VALAAVLAWPAAAQTEVPILDVGWLIVPVYMNDSESPLAFILDTGATGTSITAATAAEFGADAGREIQVQGASGLASARLVRVESLVVGPFRTTNREVIALRDGVLESAGQSFDGILGADILSRFDVLIDVPNGRLALLPHGALPATVAELGEAVAIEFVGEHIIRHTARVNGAEVTALLDSGARQMLINGVGAGAARIETTTATAERDSPGLGVEEFELRSGSLGQLVAAGTLFAGLRTLVGDLPVFRALGVDSTPTLIIGAPILARCAVFIAYSAGTVRYCRQPAPPRQDPAREQF
jgi:predicted aspartyl protease